MPKQTKKKLHKRGIKKKKTLKGGGIMDFLSRKSNNNSYNDPDTLHKLYESNFHAYYLGPEDFKRIKKKIYNNRTIVINDKNYSIYRIYYKKKKRRPAIY